MQPGDLPADLPQLPALAVEVVQPGNYRAGLVGLERLVLRGGAVAAGSVIAPYRSVRLVGLGAPQRCGAAGPSPEHLPPRHGSNAGCR
jgi:hypothetical protein